MIYDITPCPKPRQTQRDKWKKRPAVLRYRAFADEVRLKIKNVNLEDMSIIFWLPMPPSWSQKKRDMMNGELHRQKPDIDNLFKALADALYGDDSHIAVMHACKRWAVMGAIETTERM